MLKKLLIIVLVAGILYGGLLIAERMAVQELTRATNSSTQEAVCLMWKPNFLKGNGLCSLDLLDGEGRVVDTVPLSTVNSALNALQYYGDLGFQERNVTVSSRETGEVFRRLVVRDGQLEPAN